MKNLVLLLVGIFAALLSAEVALRVFAKFSAR
jgi:hypothetical protein